MKKTFDDFYRRLDSELNTKFLARQISALPVINSTNRHLKENAESLKNGEAVYSLNQTAGAGRLGRSWQGKQGDMLAFSFLIKSAEVKFLPSLLPALSLAASLSVCETLDRMEGVTFHLKWPNDVLCFGDMHHSDMHPKDKANALPKKVCGILCESSLLGQGDFNAVLGIGINLFQEAAFFIESSLFEATSLFCEINPKGEGIEAGVMPEKDFFERIIFTVANSFEKYFFDITEKGFEHIKPRYLKRCFTVGKNVKVSAVNTNTDEGCFFAKAVGVNTDGALVVEDETGQVQTVYAGDVSVRHRSKDIAAKILQQDIAAKNELPRDV